jgi:HD-GYP domain-containing protein (c-di-GMP phosphodiesterase class II)
MADASANPLPATLAAAITTRGLYPESHPRVLRTIELLAEAATARLAERDETTLLVLDGELLADGGRVDATALHGHGLTRALSRYGIERLTLRRGVGPAELTALIAGLGGHRNLEASPHVVLGRLMLADGAGDEAGGSGGGPRTSAAPRTLDALGSGFARLRTDLAGAFADLDRNLWHLVETCSRESTPLILLGELRAAEDRLFRHAVAVSLWSLALARALGIGAPYDHDLALAGLLHDVGLADLPPDLVFGRQRSPEDRARVRRHPELGAQKLCASRDMPMLPIVVALEHHLRADGGPGGYPELGRRPSFGARVVAVADTWDMVYSATVGRPRPARVEWSSKVLRQRAHQGILDPPLVEVLLELVDRWHTPGFRGQPGSAAHGPAG